MQRLGTALLREAEPERALKLLLLYERTAPFAHGKVSGMLCVARSMENKLLVAGKVWRDPPATPRVPVALVPPVEVDVTLSLAAGIGHKRHKRREWRQRFRGRFAQKKTRSCSLKVAARIGERLRREIGRGRRPRVGDG